MNLSGFTNPLSPNGTAGLVEHTPHCISTDCIRVVFRAGDDVARRYLPEPLEPIGDGLGYAFVADMLKTSVHEPDQPFLNPARTQYGEGIIAFYCRYGDQVGSFNAFIWVTQDWSMFFGQLMGWPKKMANVQRTRLNPFNPARQLQAIAPGSRLSGLVDRYGHRLLEVGIEVEREERPEDLERTERPPEMQGEAARPAVYMLRQFPSVGPDIPEIQQLVSLKLGEVRTGDVFSGKPFLKIGSGDNEDLDLLRDVDPLRAYVYKQGWITDSKVNLLLDYSAVPESALAGR